MYLDFTPEQQALRQEIRNYFTHLLTPDLRAALDAEWDECGGPVFRKVVGRMGADGWLGVGWPVEYGGQGRTPLEQLIFWDEVYRCRAPLHIIPVNTIGPALMRFGNDAQKREYLPRILRGELFFGVGYTEPSSGTDLASLQTKAVRDGDEYVIDGQKIYTTHAHDADYIWLAARTDPEAKKHKGLSIFLVPTDAPGFSVTPIYTLGGERTNATYYEGVRVPVANRVGEENQGWQLITDQLNHERITLACPGLADRLLDEVWGWAMRTDHPDGGRMIDVPWVQHSLARVFAKMEALKVMNWHSAWSISVGAADMAEASAIKVMGTEFFVECYQLLMEITGTAGVLREGEEGAIFGGVLEKAARTAATYTFGGGVNEVQRDIIAMAGLGMPRSRR